MKGVAAKTGHRIADKKTGSSYQWGGLLLILIGFVPIFLGIPIIVGVALLIVGTVKARGCVCSCCGNPVHTTSRLCPTCGATLLEPEKPVFWSVAVFLLLILGGVAWFTKDRWEPVVTPKLQQWIGK